MPLNEIAVIRNHFVDKIDFYQRPFLTKPISNKCNFKQIRIEDTNDKYIMQTRNIKEKSPPRKNHIVGHHPEIEPIRDMSLPEDISS
mgnify:CR=1 FL=1